MSFTYQVEPWAEVEEAIRGLTEGHWREIAVDKEHIPLNVNWELYRKRAQDGSLHATTVRVDAVVVGYYISFIGPHPHYGPELWGFLDAFYIVKEHRNANAGLQLFATMEDDMKRLGVKALISSTKKDHNVAPLFEYRAWDQVGYQFMKRLR